MENIGAAFGVANVALTLSSTLKATLVPIKMKQGTFVQGVR